METVPTSKESLVKTNPMDLLYSDTLHRQYTKDRSETASKAEQVLPFLFRQNDQSLRSIQW